MKKYIIILAGGKGSRMHSSVNKVLLPLCGKTVLVRSILAFSFCADKMIVVCRPKDKQIIEKEIATESLPFPIHLVEGGNTRQGSVLKGISSILPDPEDIILIHDAARCLVDHDLIERVIDSVNRYGTGIPGIPASSTFKISDHNSFVQSTLDRSRLYEIQTPQGFKAGKYIPYAMKAAEEHKDFTDDAGLVESYHIPVRIVAGSDRNIKLTRQEDLIRARCMLEGEVHSMRVGMGYDVHRLVKERKLILCGTEIPYEMGLLGHSDADVAIHALIDAMLGACSLGDIGKHFPDTDERYKGISSVVLLKETCKIIKTAGFKPHNADITIVAQKPKLLDYIPAMTEIISQELGIPVTSVNIKATTTEHLGFEGRMEGISAYAVCSVENSADLLTED